MTIICRRFLSHLLKLQLRQKSCFECKQMSNFESKMRKYCHDFSRWYHGRLDRFQSEERLRNTERHGRLFFFKLQQHPPVPKLILVIIRLQYLNICVHSYLVRESDRKPGSYVLSYFGKTGINHFRYTIQIVEQLCDHIIFIKLSSELLQCVGIITLGADSLTVFKILLATIRI